MTSAQALTCFKAYDIRGRIPDQFNADVCYRIGRAFGELLKPKNTVVGHDVRLTSPEFSDALIRGLTDAGSDIIDIGLCGTEEVYFQTVHRKADGGIMVTASHNPIDYNGMKLVREDSKPISGDSGLNDIKSLAEQGEFASARTHGAVIKDADKAAYIDHILGYIDLSSLKPLRIAANAGNGSAGIIIDKLAEYLPFEFIRINHEPDGSFPNGIPNPLLPENRSATAGAVREHSADFGIAWDGDFDRCFFFDECGNFIEGYYIVGLLAEQMLKKHPGAKIIHDPRLTWNTIETVKAGGGMPIQSKTGHAFIKERMRTEDAVYGGEMSAHHYFRNFAYCDSGMIPWLLVAEHLCRTGKTLSALVTERVRAYPCSGEMNYRVADAGRVIEHVEAWYAEQHPHVERTDGLSCEFRDWRFNLRTSNTEPLLRLNVETKGDSRLLEQRVAELSGLITQ
ncbi:MAG TPA: phosphomannomutase CpsG [Dissulfurispiraceae bacterium]|nr:phosphomannomutase CpsG [Dissulfurispiraceae bacterium]